MNVWDPKKMAFMKRYREACLRIDERTEELQRIRQRIQPGAQHISDMPGGGPKQDWTDAIATIIAIEAEIRAEIESLKDVRMGVMRVIESVDDDRYRVLLDKRYIGGKTWERIAEEMHVDYVTVWRWHAIALDMIVLPEDV